MRNGNDERELSAERCNAVNELGIDRSCTYREQPIIGENGEKKTVEFSYKRKEDMNVNDVKEM